MNTYLHVRYAFWEKLLFSQGPRDWVLQFPLLGYLGININMINESMIRLKLFGLSFLHSQGPIINVQLQAARFFHHPLGTLRDPVLTSASTWLALAWLPFTARSTAPIAGRMSPFTLGATRSTWTTWWTGPVRVQEIVAFHLGAKKHSLGKQKHLVESTKLALYYWQPAKSNLLGAQRLIFHQQCLGLVPLQQLTPRHCRSNQRRRQWSWRPQQQCRPVLWRRCRWSRGA